MNSQLFNPIRTITLLSVQKRATLEKMEGFPALLEHDWVNPDDAQQVSDSFEEVYAQAAVAQGVLTGAIATKWEADPKLSFLRHPSVGCAAEACAEWLENADDPGVKGAARAQEKMANDYGGHANKLKDLSRLTLTFTHPRKLGLALKGLKKLGFKIVSKMRPRT